MSEKLSVYKTIKSLKSTDDKNIELVYHQIEDCFYVKRELINYDLTTYQRLKDNPHDGFVQIVDLFIVEDKLIVIEEFINAPTLEVVLLNEDLSNDAIIKIMDDLCDTLSFMHALSPALIHRDIKPENIFYYRHRAILFDFDISRVYDSMKNKDTCLMGSVGYAAPEQFGFGQSDSRSDIYALGVLLNVLFTKKFPQDELYDGVEKKVIQKAISLDPEKRYQSVTSLKRALHPGAEVVDEQKSYVIPGFRHRKLVNMIIALGYYIVCFGIGLNLEIKNTTPNQLIANRITCTLWLLSIPLFIYNFGGLKRSILFSQSNNQAVQIIGLALTIFLWLIICVLGPTLLA